jgi:hypothetical protein
MKVACPPGYRTDLPPVAPEPFWFYGENIRFRMGMPETIGLYIKAYARDTGEPVVFPAVEKTATLYGDANFLMLGHGDQLTILRWDNGVRVTVPTPLAGGYGRWWFAATETEVICGRSNFNGKTYVVNRGTLTVTLLPNAPEGSMGGGIVAGILIQAGTDGFAGDSPKMVVRWSARRTDPSSSGGPGGPFGFEDWTPSDLNASGEFLLDEGSEIRGGASTQFGFMVWTDTRAILLAPRNDLYVFTKSVVSLRGILSSHAWVESDGRLWWFDQTRTLNFFDGGGGRQVMNPMRHVSTEIISDEDLDLCFMSSDIENGEVILHYPDKDGFFRELVYNYMEDAWYSFALDRISMTDAHGDRPTIGLDQSGQVYFYGIREALLSSITMPKNPPAPFHPPVPFKDPRVFPVIPSRAVPVLPEPFSFFLMTNWIAPSDTTLESLRTRNIVVSHTTATIPGAEPGADQLYVAVQSYGKLDLAEDPVLDFDQRPMGQMLRELRAGGKVIQLVLAAKDIRTHIAFAPVDVEADVSGKR